MGTVNGEKEEFIVNCPVTMCHDFTALMQRLETEAKTNTFTKKSEVLQRRSELLVELASSKQPPADSAAADKPEEEEEEEGEGIS